MIFNSKITDGKRKFYHAVFIPILLSLLLIIVFVLERGMQWDFHTAGIFPRKTAYLGGIFTMIFVHASWEHLINNVVSLTLLTSCLYFFYKQIATKILLLSYFFSGLILWFIGRDSWHIGASGLIYSMAFFLFFSGIIRKYVPLIAISLVITFIYGSMIWYLLPLKIFDTISWEGHLSGAFIGFVLSVIFKNQGPQKPLKQWEEDDEEIDESYYLDDEIEDEEKITKEISR